MDIENKKTTTKYRGRRGYEIDPSVHAFISWVQEAPFYGAK